MYEAIFSGYNRLTRPVQDYNKTIMIKLEFVFNALMDIVSEDCAMSLTPIELLVEFIVHMFILVMNISCFHSDLLTRLQLQVCQCPEIIILTASMSLFLK